MDEVLSSTTLQDLVDRERATGKSPEPKDK